MAEPGRPASTTNRPRAKQKAIPRSEWKTCECGKRIMSVTGREKCRSCHRKTVVWKYPAKQIRDQAIDDFPIPVPRTKQLTDQEADSLLMSFVRLIGDIDIAPVKRYVPGTQEFDELARLYA